MPFCSLVSRLLSFLPTIMEATKENIDDGQFEKWGEPGTFSHVCDVRVDRWRELNERGLIKLHGTPHPLIFLTISTGAVLRLL